MKKITFILCVVFGAIIWTNAFASAADFTDIPGTSPYLPYIEELNKLGIADGIADGLFGPEQAMSRADFAKFAATAFRLNDNGSPVPFADIEGHWGSVYIRAAYEAGIVGGVSDTAFMPDQPVTRQEAAAMVWRYARKQGVYPSTGLSFKEEPDTWAVESVSSVISHKWYGADVKMVSGVWSYRPKEPMSRQEMAALLDLAMKEIPGNVPPNLTQEKPMYKATYLWNTGPLLKNKAEVFQFLHKNGINLVYLQVDPDVADEEYGSFMADASTLGMEVHAIGGGPNWILPENRNTMYKLVDWVKTYNARSAVNRQFKGICLDVEPYILAVWKQDTDRMLGLWKDTVDDFVKEVKTGAPGLTTGAQLPFWLEKFKVSDGNGAQIPLSDWMIRRLDQATLMAYRDNAADIASSVENELNQAEKDGRSIIIAVETQPSGEGPITFYPGGQAFMMRELDKVISTLHGRAPFKGYAVHDYESWHRLKD